MSKFLLTTALTVFAGASVAQEVAPEAPIDMTGKISTVIAENAAGNWGATSSFDLGVNATSAPAFGSLSFVVDGTDNKVTLDEYSVGTDLGVASVSFGDQDNIWIGTEKGSTIEEVEMDESVQVSALGATVAVGLNMDDLTDITNLQGAYGIPLGIANIEAVGDYNLNTEAWIVAGRADTAKILDNVRLGGAVSYGSVSETVGFEADATVYGITGYLAGDQNDMTKDIGASMATNFGGMNIDSGVNYNFDTEAYAPSVELSFSF